MSLYIPKMSDTPGVTIPGLADNFSEIETQLATKANKTPGTVYTATLLNGYTGEIKFSKNDLGIVTLQIVITPPTPVATLTDICAIPSGYRPVVTMPVGVTSTTTGVGVLLYLSRLGALRGGTLNGLEAGREYAGTVQYLSGT